MRGHHPIVEPILREWLPATPANILDAGCGQGEISLRMVELGHRVAAIDLPGRSLDLANKLREESAAQWKIVAGSVENPEFPKASFDVIVSVEVIEHLYRPVTALMNLASLLKPGGTLILSTPYHGYLKNLAICVTGKWDWHHSPLHEGGHIKFWSKQTLTAALKKADLAPVDWRGVGRVPLLWKSIMVRAVKQ